jgi:hypothetical protein
MALLLSSGIFSDATTTGPIVFNLTLKPHAEADPAVLIAMKNTSDDDYGLNPAQWLIVQKANANRPFMFPLVNAKHVDLAYAAVPAHGTLFLNAARNDADLKLLAKGMPDEAVVDATASPSWIVLHGFHLIRTRYGSGRYIIRYCSELADRSTVCSGSISLQL